MFGNMDKKKAAMLPLFSLFSALKTTEYVKLLTLFYDVGAPDPAVLTTVLSAGDLFSTMAERTFCLAGRIVYTGLS